MKTVTLTFQVPEDLEDTVLRMGPVQWGAAEAASDAKHKAQLGQTIRLTREFFGPEAVPALTQMHGLYLEGSDRVLCHTGVSPNSPNNARALAGLWNALHTELLNIQHAETAEVSHAD